MIWFWLVGFVAFCCGIKVGWEIAMYYMESVAHANVRRMAKQRRDSKSVHIIHVRMTPEEVKALDSKKGSRTRSDYIRQTLEEAR